MHDLAGANTLSHHAVQWISKAARANIEPADDDHHASLVWEHNTLSSLPLDATREHRLAFSFQSAELLWNQDGKPVDRLAILGATETEVGAWVDRVLQAAGLHPTGDAEMPYALEPIERYVLDYHREDYRQEDSRQDDDRLEIQTLGSLYGLAHDAFIELIKHATSLRTTKRPTIHYWPHHFDIAVLFTLANEQSIGVGMSPGDGSYSEPYFYCSPWPYPADASTLPDAPQPFSWHTEGFTGLVAPVGAFNPTEITAGIAAALASAHSVL